MKKERLIEIYLALGALLVIILAGVISYGTNFQDPVSKFVKSISPAIIVREEWVTVNGLDQAKYLANKLDNNLDENLVVAQIIKQKKMEVLKNRLRIEFGEKDVVDEFVYYTTNKNIEYKRLIKDYFDNQEFLFIDGVIRPTAIEVVLIRRYNADFGINNTEFNQIKTIQGKLQAGESFEDLAKTYSDDKLTGQFGGDLGFFEIKELIPELKEKAKNAIIGEVYSQVVISRYGYHLLYPVQTIEEEGKTLWQIKHILIETHGFDKWLEAQTNNIPVWVIKS
jgi:hypothetical protein